jgi:hypothetical protein
MAESQTPILPHTLHNIATKVALQIQKMLYLKACREPYSNVIIGIISLFKR